LIGAYELFGLMDGHKFSFACWTQVIRPVSIRAMRLVVRIRTVNQ